MASEYTGSIISTIVGVALLFTPFAPMGAGLIVSGIFSAAAIALAPDVSEASDEKQSPTYGFSQFRNPTKGDSPIPVIYSSAGHKTAPVWLQAFVTPRGLHDEDSRRSSRYQRLSGLLAIAEGTIEDVTEIRFNDEPVFERIEREFGQGNGSRKKWVLSQNKIDPKSVVVSVDGVAKGYLLTSTSELIARPNGTQQTFSVDLPDDIVDSEAIRFYNINPDAQPAGSFNLEAWRVDMQFWMVSPTRMLVHSDTPRPRGSVLYMKYGARTTNGLTIKKVDGKVEIKFATAPANGAKLTVQMVRKRIGKVDISIRSGGAHQLPIWGFHQVRNTFGVQQSMPKAVTVSKDTRDEVDNMIVNLVSGEGGFISFDDEGKSSGVKAQFKIEVQRQVTSAAGGNTFDTWYTIPDPRGTGPTGSNKNALEFEVLAETVNQQFWSFDIRNLLEKNDKNATGNGASAKAIRKAFADFTRALYRVRLVRTNPVSANGANSHFDELVFSSVTEVQDEALSLPGTALIGFHALGTERLNGGAPNVTMVVKGRRDVANAEVFANNPSGYRWVPRTTNQANRVWAAIDLMTNWRYGAGEHFDRDTQIDIPSAIECAAWLDEVVTKGDGSQDEEVRSRLDIVIDTRKSLMEHVREILTPGRIWAFQRGDTWHFVKDDAVTLKDSVGLDAVPVLYDDTRAGRTAKNSLAFTHDTVVSRPTEIQLTHLDEDQEFQSKQVWVMPQEPEDSPRRIRRVTARGTTRATEVSRYGLHIFRQLSVQGASVSVGANPAGLDYGVGDVIRIVSERVGIDGYWRIFDLKFNTDSFFVTVMGKQYIPGNYLQNGDKQRIITDGFSKLLAQPIPRIRAPAADLPETQPTTVTRRQPRGNVARAKRNARARGVLRARIKRTA